MYHMNAEVENNRILSIWHRLPSKQALLEESYGSHAIRMDLSQSSALFVYS